MEDALTPAEFTGVVETASAATYPLPTTDIGTLRRLRPGEIQGPEIPGPGDIVDRIGPYQEVGDALWFGKTFYDGEGLTGAGGFGYFHLVERRYVMFTPPALIDWSASAVLVESDAIWIGMIGRGEGADRSGGLLRYDRAAGRTQVFGIGDPITSIVRHEGDLVIGTVYGLYVMRGAGFTRYLIEPSLSGVPELIELP
jgi:hypothetical protein